MIGRKPLASWLKAHMVPDILKSPVSEEFLACVPSLSEVKMDTGSRVNSKAPPKKEQQQQAQEESMEVVLVLVLQLYSNVLITCTLKGYYIETKLAMCMVYKPFFCLSYYVGTKDVVDL